MVLEAEKFKLSPDQVAEQLGAEAALFDFAYGEERFTEQGLLHRCGELIFNGTDRVWRREDVPNSSELSEETRALTGGPRVRSIIREVWMERLAPITGEREMRVLMMLVGAENDGRARTLEEAGQAIGKSKSTAWRLKERALDSLNISRETFRSHIAHQVANDRLIAAATS